MTGSGKVTGLLFVNISKAFDSLNQKVLLGMLGSLGLHGFQSYLAARRQRVLMNGEDVNLSILNFLNPVKNHLCYSCNIICLR